MKEQRCTKKDKATSLVELAGSIAGQNLETRECYVCDGYEKMCERYESREIKRIFDPWLGLWENYLK